MSKLSEYLSNLRSNRATGAATDETSFYPPLANLLNTVGEGLDPEVRCVMQMKDTGAGHPDGGLFTASQIPASDVPLFDESLFEAQTPQRGAIEVKAPGQSLDTLQDSDQVDRYLDRYGLVLITNYRAFRLLGADGPTGPDVLEDFELAGSADELWQLTRNAGSVPDALEERFTGFVSRTLQRNAPLIHPEDVAALLASYARDARIRLGDASLDDLAVLRDALEESLGIEFQGDRGEGFFRSTVIQTIFYGLFSAWVLWHREAPSRSDDFDWHEATEYLRVPVLERLFNQVVVPSQLRRLRLMELMNWTEDALNRIDRASFFARFEEERAVQYFYEPFLERFDPELREQLGVWYTPSEVVEYQVRRVDTVLREELDIADGLASDDVLVLDPCCGTGAYLVEVLRVIADRLEAQGSGALTAEKLRKAATERIFGFEILTAPYVVAHLQIGLFLAEIGAPLLDTDDDRAAVYLTNALTGWKADESRGEKRTFPEFKAERLAAERVKQDSPILVILGNPPYSGYPGVAVGEERVLSEAYRQTQNAPEPRGQGLNDLYVRFFRMAERQIVENTGKGIVCYISNSSWLDGLSHNGMREQYLKKFDRIWIDNMNGDKYRTGKVTPEGKPDPSVFSTKYNRVGIQVGTAVALLCRNRSYEKSDDIRYREFWGKKKRRELLETALPKSEENNSRYTILHPKPELGYPFAPRESSSNYLEWPMIPDLFSESFPGVQSKRDDLVVDTDRDRLIKRMRSYFDPEVSHEEMAALCPRAMADTNKAFDPVSLRERYQAKDFLPEYVVKYCFRAMDVRWIYWEPRGDLLGRKSPDFFPNAFPRNSFIEARRRESKDEFCRGTPTSLLADNFGAGFSNFFPMYLNPEAGGGDLFSQPSADGDDGEPIPNLSERAEGYLDAVGGDVEALFYHTLATLHAPSYRQENDGALRQDWPRVPLPKDGDVLAHSAELGREVAALLDVEQTVPGVTAGDLRTELRPLGPITSTDPDQPQVTRENYAVTAGWGYEGHHGATMPGSGQKEERPLTPDEEAAMPDRGIELWGDTTWDIYLNDRAYWQHIPARVWDYTLGGYPVIKKWLSYREEDVLGRHLELDEVQHVTHMTRRIAALLLLEPQLDANYEAVKSAT
jgi:hypothetical protein